MSSGKLPIEVWIVMSDAGGYVVADNEDTAQERADEEFDEEEVRWVKLSFKMSPPSRAPEAVQTFEFELD